jgi:hypothetical protein
LRDVFKKDFFKKNSESEKEAATTDLPDKLKEISESLKRQQKTSLRK